MLARVKRLHEQVMSDFREHFDIQPHSIGLCNATSYLGVCRKKFIAGKWIYRVFISKYMKDCTDNEIKNVIAHELIHCIPECNNHGTPYKLKAFEAHRLGYNVFCDDGMTTFNKATKTVSQHIYKCEKCGKEYNRIRRVNTDKYRCPCGGHLQEV